MCISQGYLILDALYDDIFSFRLFVRPVCFVVFHGILVFVFLLKLVFLSVCLFVQFLFLFLSCYIIHASRFLSSMLDSTSLLRGCAFHVLPHLQYTLGGVLYFSFFVCAAVCVYTSYLSFLILSQAYVRVNVYIYRQYSNSTWSYLDLSLVFGASSCIVRIFASIFNLYACHYCFNLQ